MQRSKGSGEHMIQIHEWRAFQTEETARAKTLRQEHALRVSWVKQGGQCGWSKVN